LSKGKNDLEVRDYLMKIVVHENQALVSRSNKRIYKYPVVKFLSVLVCLSD
jgi:hypothetical protein